MQAFKVLSINSSLPHKKLFSTSSWRNRYVGWTVNQILEWKGPRCLKPHRVMWKFLEKTKTKGIFSNPPVGFPSFNLETAITSIACRSIPVTRRSAILNKILMRNITEILSTSDVGLPLIGYDIQISHVKVTPDFRSVSVFWIPKGTEEDEKIQHLLNKTANPLRLELNNLRTVGLVPVIYFVKDKYHALIAEVDRRLKIADFGDDYIPALQEHHHILEDLQLNKELPDELKEKITQLEEDQPFNENEETALPPMRMDTFRLNYNKILHTIKQGTAKSKTLNEKLNESIFDNPQAVFKISENTLEKESWDKTSFKKYLKRRQIKIRKSQLLKARELENTHIAYNEGHEAADINVELYNEFVKNAFEDDVDFNENFENYEDRYEQEQ